MTKRKIIDDEDISDLYPIQKKTKPLNEVKIINKKRKHDDDDYTSSLNPAKKFKISDDDILNNENICDYIKKRRDMMIYT